MAFPGICMHEFVATAKPLKKFGVKGMDVAKRLIDFASGLTYALFFPPANSQAILGLLVQGLFFVAVGWQVGLLTALVKSDRERLSHNRNQLLSLQRVTSNYLSSFDYHDLVSQLVTEARGLTKADATLFLRTESGELKMTAHDGFDEREINLTLARIGQYVVKAHEHGAPLIINNANAQKAFPFASFIACPVYGDRTMFVFSRKPRKFTQDEAEFLATFADEASLALNSAASQADRQRNLEIVAALSDINRAAANLEEPATILSLSTQKAVELLDGQKGMLLLHREHRGFVLGAKEGLLRDEESYVQTFLARHNDTLTPLAETPRTFSFTLREPSYPDARTTEALEELLAGTFTRSVMFSPLVLKGSLTGYLVVMFSETRGFSDDELQFIEGFAAQLSLVLYNARLLGEVKNLTLRTVEALSLALDSRTPYTQGHSERVSRVALAVGKELGLSPKELKRLHYASLLHDIGKIRVNDEPYSKQGRLSPDEIESLKRLPELSGQIVKPIAFFEDVIPLIYHHKERYDGKGYPAGLKGEEIPLGARIIGLAEAFVAMTSIRPYRPAMSTDEAVAEIRQNTEKQFDPLVVDAFMRAMMAQASQRSAQNANIPTSLL